MSEPYNRMMSHLILVLGMHRSGTSALTGTLLRLGVSLGSPLIEATEDNPKGFYEHAGVVEADEAFLESLHSAWDDPAPIPDAAAVEPDCKNSYRNRLAALLSSQGGWDQPLCAIKDPRLCRLIPFWQSVLGERDAGVSALFVVRNPADVIASLMRRDGLNADHAALIWLRHYIDAERSTRDWPRALVLYEGLFGDWRSELAHAAEQTGIEWPRTLDDARKEVETFLDPGLRHHRDSSTAEKLSQPLKRWIDRCTQALATGRREFLAALEVIGLEVDEWDAQVGPFWSLARERNQWRQESLRLWADLEWFQSQRDAHVSQIKELQEGVQWLNETLDSVYASRSWRLTRPMRGVMRRARQIATPILNDLAGPEFESKDSGTVTATDVSADEIAPASAGDIQPEASDLLTPPRKSSPVARVLIVTPDLVGPIRNGGIGTAFTAMAEQLSAANFEVTVLFTLGQYTEGGPRFDRWQKHYADEGIRLVPLLAEDNEPKLEAPRYCWHAYRVYLWMKRHADEFDIAYFPEWRGEAFYVLAAKQVGIAFNELPIGVVTHSPTAWADRGNYVLPARPDELDLEFMERRVVETADFVISPSQYLLDWMQDEGWHLPSDTRVIQNMMPDPLPDTSAVDRVEVPISEYVFFGRLEVRKGLSLFISGLKRLPKDRASGLQVTFLGKAIHSNGFDPVAFIESELEGWPGRYKLITDYSRDQALEYLKQPGRIAVIASLVENSPYTVLECLLDGIPFIASNVGGIAELIHSGDRERVIFNPTPAGIVKALERVSSGVYTPARVAIDPGETEEAWISLQHEFLSRERAAPRLDDALPHITVCLTHYNRPDMLGTALESLKNQTYADFDVVLIDDGSPSARATAYIESLKPEFDNRGWTIITQENAYLGAARNHAAEHVTGEYVMFMDDDNIAKPHELETFARAAAFTGADILTTVSDVFESDYSAEWPERSVHLWIPMGNAPSLGVLRNVFGDSNALVRLSTFRELGGFTEDYGVGHEDWEFFARASLEGADIRLIPEPLFWYRVSATSMIRSGDMETDHARSIRPYQKLMPDGLGQTLAFALHMYRAHNWSGAGSWTELSQRDLKQQVRLAILAGSRVLDPDLRDKFVFSLRRHGVRSTLRRALEYVSLRQ